MGRLVSCVASVLMVGFAFIGLVGCGGNSVNGTNFPVPASVVLTPAGSVSLDLGSTQAFTGSARNSNGTTIIEPVAFQSSNPAVVTVANNGMACAGSWNSLANPQVCTPGQTGTALITANARGVSSPPATVYVHQHIDSVVITPVPPGPNTPCISKDLKASYQATAFSRGTDITPTVGQFTWQAVASTVVLVSNTAPGLGNVVNGVSLNEVEATANVPGLTQIFASVAGVNSQPFDFTTCAVDKISLAVSGTSATSFTIAQGGTQLLTPTIVDTLGTTITGNFLTWNTSDLAVATVTSSGSVHINKAGTISVIASCTPPTCNIGFTPPQPIYPNTAIVGTGTSTVTTEPAGTIYVSTTGCATVDNCISEIVPITLPGNTVGNPTALPATPNSLVFNHDATRVQAYMGTDVGLQGTRGLMVLNVASNFSITRFSSIVGKVLAVSPNGAKVIISDTVDTPNQVFVFDTASSTSVSFLIPGATAAAFSPDNLKGYILAGSTLYVYSTQDALQTIPLAAPAIDVDFLSEGAFAYIAGGSPNAVTVRRTCDNAPATDSGLVPQVLPTPATPNIIKTLPSGNQVIALDTPGVDLINVSSINAVGCPTTVSNTVSTFNLGQGTFTPTQMILSPNGSRAYILAGNLNSILVFDIGNQTSSAIPLSGTTNPIHATLTEDGNLLYVGATDGMVHVVDTVLGGDVQQITFPSNQSTLQQGLCAGITLPIQTLVNISAASQSGAYTTFTYTLTSGPPLAVGMHIAVSGMTNTSNNGSFVITGLGSGTFTVINTAGVNASGENGIGNLNITCTPDLIALRP